MNKIFYDKVLIISDNPFLCSKILHIISKLSLKREFFSFAASPFSNPNDFNYLDINTFNLKSESDVSEIIKKFNLVFSIHCKQIFPPKLVQSVKCINIHPGYNPINRGWYPQVFSIINDLPIGATIHEIDEKLDHGSIIAREYVEKFGYDTSESLYNRILEKEIQLIEKNLLSILCNNYNTIEPEIEGNLYLKKDFNNLKQINLEENFKAGELINRLRALTHGNFKNAFFIDKETGKKIFINVSLIHED